MLKKDDIKKEITYLIICFPTYEPVMEGDANVFTVWQECFANIPADTLHEAVQDCTLEPNRKFAPSVGEIIHAIKEIPFKGMSASDRFDKENGLRPIHEVLREMGIYDQDDEVQRQKYLKSQAEKELHHE